MDTKALHGSAVIGIWNFFLFGPLPCRQKQISIKNLRSLDLPEESHDPRVLSTRPSSPMTLMVSFTGIAGADA